MSHSPQKNGLEESKQVWKLDEFRNYVKRAIIVKNNHLVCENVIVRYMFFT